MFLLRDNGSISAVEQSGLGLSEGPSTNLSGHPSDADNLIDPRIQDRLECQSHTTPTHLMRHEFDGRIWEGSMQRGQSKVLGALCDCGVVVKVVQGFHQELGEPAKNRGVSKNSSSNPEHNTDSSVAMGISLGSPGRSTLASARLLPPAIQGSPPGICGALQPVFKRGLLICSWNRAKRSALLRFDGTGTLKASMTDLATPPTAFER